MPLDPNDNFIQALLNFEPVAPSAVLSYNPPIILPTSPNKNYTTCDVDGGLDLAIAQVEEYLDTFSFSPVEILKIDLQAAEDIVIPQVESTFKEWDKIISVADPGVTIALKSQLSETLANQTVTPVEVPANTLTFEESMAQMGAPFVRDKASAEQNLQVKGIWVVNGLWIKEGNLDLSCVKTMYRHIGGNPCETLAPYLNKDKGDFTFICTTKVLVDTTTLHPCPPHTFINACTKSEVSVEVETAIGTDVRISAILGSRPDLTRDDLIFYVFWNKTMNLSAHTLLRLKLLGFTEEEILEITTKSSTDQVKTCLIKDPDGILNYLCTFPDDAGDILEKGPAGADPDPQLDDLIHDIMNTAQNPTYSGVAVFDNIPLLILGTLDLSKTFSCRNDLGQYIGDAVNSTAQGVRASTAAYDAATGVINGAQSLLMGPHNQVAALLSSVQELINDYPGTLLSCLYPGSGFGLSLPFPKAALTSIQQLLGLLSGQVLGLFDALDALLTGLLPGLCVAATMLQGVAEAGPATTAGVNAVSSASVVSAEVTVGLAAYSCDNVELDWPDEVLSLLQCLLKLIRLVEDLISAALNTLRSMLNLVLSLSLEFGFSVLGGQICSPADVVAALSAIEGIIQPL